MNIATNTAGTPISVAPNIPFQIAITPDGTLAYVGTSNNAVVVINLLTNTVQTTVPIGGGNLSRGISITPDQAPVAAFTFISPGTFDASNSVSPTGTIVNYLWNFGDGTTLSTTSPIVNHQYAVPGTYTVTLTVINSAGTSTTQIFTGQTMLRNGSLFATLTQNITTQANVQNFSGTVVKINLLHRQILCTVLHGIKLPIQVFWDTGFIAMARSLLLCQVRDP
ncbi:MAG: PKD domain-containing protein [Parachlamydiaceae bacterium]|nr:MAG: PKD domain-containing protein [Parachlamydiaceae bacterium]